MEKLTEFAIAVVLAVALTGNLDKFTYEVHIATLKLLKESQASKWGSPRFFKVIKKGH
ncbi:MAG: hypothetical protein ACXVB4_18385 [Pseudobdellovibrionaceae bacterium]